MILPNRLSGHVAIVTGAAGDLGLAIVERLLDAGMRVALLDLDTRALSAHPPTGSALPARTEGDARQSRTLLLPGCDIRDEEQVVAAVAQVVSHFGSIRVLVNNAAMVTPKSPVADLPVSAWRDTLDVNLTGAWLMTRACWPHLIGGGGGTVLNIASQMGHVGSPGGGAYGVSKAGLIALARAIAVDGAPHGIRGLSLSPGAVMTSRLTNRYGNEQAVRAALAPKYLAGEIGSPDEVAQAAWFLLNGGSFLNGCDLLVDGGYTTT
ncbi:MAG: SDR family NAD(P)-dependent oxidoreductase [Rubrivivax sp.]